jgi:hypothetical protein
VLGDYESVSRSYFLARHIELDRRRAKIIAKMSNEISIYLAMSEAGFELCYPTDPSDFDTIDNLINGERRVETWHPIPVQLIRKDGAEVLARSDAPWLGMHALIFRSGAAHELKDILEAFGELLPLRCDGEDLLIYNPTRVLDALDLAGSSIERLSDGRMMRIIRYTFIPAVVNDIDVFKLRGLRVSQTLVSGRFAREWKARGYRGLEFPLVWSSSGGPVSAPIPGFFGLSPGSKN